MKKKSILSALLVSSFLITPCLAMPNYNYTTVINESYTDNYYHNQYDNRYYGYYNRHNNNYYNYNYNHNNQSYYNYPNNRQEKTTVISETYTDTRDNFDKNIDRTGKIIGITAGAAIVGTIIALAFRH